MWCALSPDIGTVPPMRPHGLRNGATSLNVRNLFYSSPTVLQPTNSVLNEQLIRQRP